MQGAGTAQEEKYADTNVAATRILLACSQACMFLVGVRYHSH